MAQDINPNLLLIAGLGVAAYLVWKSYADKAPKGGSDGSLGGVGGAAGDLLAGPAPVASNDEVTGLDRGFVHPDAVLVQIDSPAEGGQVAHTPLRNTFPVRLYLDNYTEKPVTEFVRITANVDARYVPSGVDTFTTTFGPVTVASFGRRYLQIPVNFGSELSFGPAGWDVSITVEFGGASDSRSFQVN